MRGCRLWKGALNSDGYPILWYRGRPELVTRIVLTAKLGRTIKPKHEAAHTCHVRRCIAEEHLVEETHSGNCRMGRNRRKNSRAA